VNRYLEEVARK